MQKTKVFIAYARTDEPFLLRLREYLAPLERKQAIEVWYDGKIEAGEKWDEKIKTHLHAADLILLLVSAKSLASNYFYNEEMKDALARHERKEAIVVPVILSYCDWKETPLGKLQAIPKDAKPITSWSDESAAYYNVIQNIKVNLKTIQKRKKQPTRLQPTTSDTKPISQNKNNINFGKILKIVLPILIGITAIFGVLYLINSPDDNELTTKNKNITTVVDEVATTPSKTDNDVAKKEETDDKKQKQHKSEIQKNKKETQFIPPTITNPDETPKTQFVPPAITNPDETPKTQFVPPAITNPDETPKTQFVPPAITNPDETSEKLNSLPEPIQRLINDMVFVEGGTFEMGCTNEDQTCWYGDRQVHKITLSNFKIGKYEVTQDQWQAVMGSNPSYFKDCGGRCPVEQVNWNDAKEFIEKLEYMTDITFRLVTEAEWEYAARGGNRSQGYLYAGSNDIDMVAWYDENSFNKGSNHPDYGTHIVGTKKTNELGLYDMSGNVWEWCSDWYDKNYYNVSPHNNPQGPTFPQKKRIIRGGSWSYDANDCPVSERFYFPPDLSGDNFGLRLAQSL